MQQFYDVIIFLRLKTSSDRRGKKRRGAAAGVQEQLAEPRKSHWHLRALISLYKGRLNRAAHRRTRIIVQHQPGQQNAPKCKHGVTNGNNLDSNKWREGMKCPKCWKEFTADHGRPPDPEQKTAKQKRPLKNKARNTRSYFTPTRGLSRFGTIATLLHSRSSMSTHDEKKPS